MNGSKRSFQAAAWRLALALSASAAALRWRRSPAARFRSLALPARHLAVGALHLC
jgi:hypothetical protein